MNFLNLVICNPCTETLGKRYDKTFCKTVTRAYGSDRMIGFHCSVSFEDILDVAASGEWDTYLTNGKILVTPSMGKFDTGEGTTETLEDGCGVKYSDITERPWTFETASVSDDYSDEQWWRAFHLEFSNYNWGWILCGGRLVLNDTTVQAVLTELEEETPAAVPITTPGFAISTAELASDNPNIIDV